MLLIRFAKFDARMEGWLQGEILDLLSEMGTLGLGLQVVSMNKPDTGTGGNRPDFVLEVNGNKVFMEIKVLIGQRGKPYPKARMQVLLPEVFISWVMDQRVHETQIKLVDRVANLEDWH